MVNETETKVKDFLNSLCCAVNTVALGETTRDNNWKCDKWNICLVRNGKAQAFDYYTGIGHRKTIRGLAATKYPGAEFIKGNWQVSIAQKPDVTGLIHSIILDGSACEESFEDWRSNFGYDTDSRKALETYLACQENYNKFRKLFSHAEIEALRELLQDY